MMARAEAVFIGKVQGVWFRANTQRFAVEHGVVGIVRNLDDGSVEAVFEGDRNSIESVIYKCKNKQPHARVSSCRVIWTDLTDDFMDFMIIR